tara:strand:- start:2521 stop:2982 length:462 start_codon:yes stop_codon:yes gene_type:complete
MKSMHELKVMPWLLRTSRNEPEALHSARFDKREMPVSILRPVPVRGRLDRVTITNANDVYVSDTKSRKKHVVTEKDVLQVSLGRMLCLYSGNRVFHGSGRKMKFPERAFIHTVSRTDGTERWHVVKTIPPSQLIPIYLDYLARSDDTVKHAAG